MVKIKKEEKATVAKDVTVKMELSNPEKYVLLAIHTAKTITYEKKDKQGKVEIIAKKGCHVIYDGLCGALRNQFGIEDSRALTERMVEKGLIAVRPAKGGAILYLPQDAPAVKVRAVDRLSGMPLSDLDKALAAFQA